MRSRGPCRITDYYCFEIPGRAGIGNPEMMALLGHTTRAMSERYIKGRQTVVAEPVRKKL
jgi:hypothetical protein